MTQVVDAEDPDIPGRGVAGQRTMPLRSETSIGPSLTVQNPLDNTRSPPLPERPVEVEGGADEGQVRERLGEVA